MTNSTKVLDDIVRQDPEAIALVSDDETLTYGELNRHSDAVAAFLAKRGVGSGDLVPIEATRSTNFVIGLLGILKAGAAYVPIDHAYPSARKAYIIEQSRSVLLLTTAPGMVSSIADVQVADIDTIRKNMGDATAPARVVAPTDVMYVIFTSGTTGVPKGVIIEHHSVATVVGWHNRHFHIDAQSRSTSMAALGFDIAHWEIWSALCAGSRLYLLNDATRRDPAELVRSFERERITHAFVPTVMAADVVMHGADLSSLKYLFTGGEKLSPINTDHVHFSLIDYYGPTEATMWATCRPVASSSLGREPSIGTAIGEARIWILDKSMREVVGNAIGEICISGGCLARGYLHNEALTNERFPLNPLDPGQRIYRTGDLGRYLPDGSVQFLGRLDEQVKIRGHLVEPSEVEATLARHPGIRKASVTATLPGDGNSRELVAFLIPENLEASHRDIVQRVRETARALLPDYMVPAHYVIRDNFPLNANGKTDKATLLAGFTRTAVFAQTFDEIADPIERSVLLAFQAALEHSNFQREDNFFLVGGHSMLAAQVIARLSEKLSLSLRITDIYNHPTAETLAAEIRRRPHASSAVSDYTPPEVLWRDVVLPDDIVFSGSFDRKRLADPAHVLLTGVTGFVGVHLLAELLTTTRADVHCIVRARSAAEAMRRIREKIEEYRVPVAAANIGRIKVHAGDIASPGFGLKPVDYDTLCQQVEVIHHSASAVNFIKPYAAMKRDNVDGLVNIIRFAATAKTKALMLLSTISIYSWGYWITKRDVVTENDDIDQNLEAICSDIGYVKSKWVMEKIADLARTRGLPLATFRLGYATYHTHTGLSADYQWWGRLVKTCIAHRMVPDLHELREGLSSVDYMTKAVAHIARKQSALGQKFNLIHSGEGNVSLKQFFNLLERYFGFEFRVVPFREWRDHWVDVPQTPLYPVLNLFRDPMYKDNCIIEMYQQTYLWRHDNTSALLKGSGIVAPAFDEAELRRYLEHSLGIRADALTSEKGVVA
ncbi:amino acid adenylation domain-containing protein [Paraburkholderia humisilvae]|uniref:Linear gramicidin synthase subunit D n=1 Tax=Paraburkholderia humisilvae TaxID=627669 RepID=A0A6J5F6M3_9BURK|nr:amino acid adenylation domain-containing protein [Paraburkholderia humisilvae]CAB3774520.1 Linear gramicidin synthase subunit D [Paraburkholderia humisilvae]